MLPVECANIARAFKSGDFTPFMSGGLLAEGVYYIFLREQDGKVVYAKCKPYGTLTLQASKTAIVIARCPEGCLHGNANKAVWVIAEYLESMNM